MSAKGSSLESYNRRLFAGTLIVLLVLACVSAFLPFRWASEKLDNKLTTMMEAWSTHLYSRARSFAEETEKPDLMQEKFHLEYTVKTRTFQRI